MQRNIHKISRTTKKLTAQHSTRERERESIYGEESLFEHHSFSSRREGVSKICIQQQQQQQNTKYNVFLYF